MKYWVIASFCFALVSCGGGGGSSSSDDDNNVTIFKVTATAGVGGSITPASSSVDEGSIATLTVTPDVGFSIDGVSGCSGILSGNTYTTGAIIGDCMVNANFAPVVVTTNNQVVYIAHNQSVADTDSLYIVDVEGTNPSRLTPDLVEGGNVIDFAWSGDGSRIIYRADQDADGRLELYSVLPDGTGLVKLNEVLLDGAGVTNYKISPTGTTIAYLARQDDAATTELYVVNSDGSNNTKLNDTLTSGGNVSTFTWSPNGVRILYLSDLEANERFELYAVNADGSSHQNVNDDLGGNQTIFDYRWSPDSSYIAYVIEDDANSLLSGSTNKTIYSYSLDEKSNNILLENQTILSFEWRSDSEYVVIVNGGVLIQTRPFVNRTGYDTIWVNKPNGGNLVDLTQSIKSNNLILPEQFGFVPNSNTMAILSENFGTGGTVDFHLVSLSDGSIIDKEITSGTGGIFLNYNYFNDGLNLTSEQRMLYYNQLKYSPFTFSPDGRYIIINDTALSIYDTQGETLLEVATQFLPMRSLWLNTTDSILYYEMDNSFAPFTFERFFTNPIIINPIGSVIADIDQLLGGDDSIARAVDPMLLGDNQIAFERFPTLQKPLVTLGTDGQNLTVVSDEAATEIVDYQLTSDGASIIYIQGCNGLTPCPQSALYSVNLDGSNRTKISADIFTITGVKAFAVKP